MKIEDYRLPIALDETETLRRTAEILYISQPAAAQKLKTTENAFGVDIFIRTKKQLITTTEGTMIIEHARDMLKRGRLFFDKTQACIGEMSGTVSIGCSSLIGQTLLPEILSLYNTQFPNIEIQVQVGSTGQIRADHRDYYVMIARGNKVMNLANTHLFNDGYYFILPKDRRGDVTKLPFIEFQANPVYMNQVKQWYNDNLEQDYHATITVDQVTTCKEILIGGIGITISLEIMMKNISKGQFESEEVEINNEPLTRSTFMSYGPSMLQLPQADSSVDLMMDFVEEPKA